MTINEDKDKRDIENLLPEKETESPCNDCTECGSYCTEICKKFRKYKAEDIVDKIISDSTSNLLEAITGEEELKDICCIHFDCTPDDCMCDSKDCRALSMFNMLTKKYIILERK